METMRNKSCQKMTENVKILWIKILFNAEIMNFSLTVTLSKLLYIVLLYSRRKCFGNNTIFNQTDSLRH